MKAVLRYLHSPDLADLENGTPADPQNFCILIQAMVGPDADEDSEESFDFLLCTPQWLTNDLNAKKSIWGRHYLLVARYDFSLVQDAVKKVCGEAQGPDWKTVAAFLSRYGKWEFEDYKE